MPLAKAPLLALVFVLLTTGCSWVRVSEAGAAITVAASVPDPGCRRVGGVTARTRATVGGMARDASRIERELEDLARDEAVGLGADVLVPAGEITAGRRSYDAYTCPGAANA
jgi:hypothetical protein